MRKIITAVFLAVALLGCTATPGPSSGVSLTPPRTFGETLVYGYTTNAAVRRAAASALNAGIIKRTDASQVLTTTNTARAALDEARKAGCPSFTTEPKESDKPACLEGLPDTTVGKLKFAVGLADQAFAFLKTLGAVK
jgi:hypothetical protein